MDNKTIPVVLICDDNYVMPTCVAIHSIINTKNSDTRYDFFIICASLTAESEAVFRRFENEDVHINVIRQDASKFAELHTFKEGAFCVATPAALLKFVIPELIPQYDKVLYMDGDIIVREDLTTLYNTDLRDAYLAAVVDSGSLYVKNKYIEQVENYFNSGVMLLNVKVMREKDLTQTLIKTKMELSDSNLMDQNVFNVVCDGHMIPLPVRYNFLPVNLVRAKGKWTLQQINNRYGTNYANVGTLFRDAAIIHYSSKDKPWKVDGTPFVDDWYHMYMNTPIEHMLSRCDVTRTQISSPKVSVIIPVYNVENYLAETMDCILSQTLRDIEVICIDDGSTDSSLALIQEYARKDSRVCYYTQKNRGQGFARNVGISMAKGEYIYFMDSDDLLDTDALLRCYEVACWNDLDLVLFEGSSFFETPKLEKIHANYKTLYNRKSYYPEVYNGEDLYGLLTSNWDFIISPAMRLYRRKYLEKNRIRFPEDIKLEDNFFAFQSLICAKRAKVMPYAPYKRRVRENSTMTEKNDYRKYVGYHATACKILSYIGSHEVKDVVVRAAALHICQWLNSANEYYMGLDNEWKEFSKTDPNVPVLNYALLAPILLMNRNDFLRNYHSENLETPFAVNVGAMRWEINKLKNENASLKKQIEEYRICGKKQHTNWLSAKIRGGIQCCKENGFSYTVRYTLKRVFRKLCGGAQCCKENGVAYTVKYAFQKYFQ